MLVNGKEIILQREISVSQFLKNEGYNEKKVAVEKNGQIVPKRCFESEILLNEDKIEIVCFVGGG